MIVKKIPAKKSKKNGGSQRAQHAGDLVGYMADPNRKTDFREHIVKYMLERKLDRGPERLLHLGARNFVCDDIVSQRAEMMATAQSAVRSPNPIDHWLLSWREGDSPSPSQVDAAVGMFLEDMGASHLQCIWAVHGDTRNVHVHIALNRHDPILGKTMTLAEGLFLESAHQSVARMVERFGWQAEEDARYVSVGGVATLSPSASEKIEKGTQSIKMAAAAFEVRTGYKSAQRIAQECALPIIETACSWEELHQRLAAQGIAYDPSGTNGAIVSVGGERVKASDVNRNATISKLSKRLGAFALRCADLAIADRPVGLDRLPEAFRAEEYRAERRAWDAADADGRGLLIRPAANHEEWLRDRDEEEAASAWRMRRLLVETAAFEGEVATTDRPQNTIDGFRPQYCFEGTRYARDGEGTAFIDRGSSITLHKPSDEAILAALRLADEKFAGKIRIRADEKVRRRIFEVAYSKGLSGCLIDPDLAQLHHDRALIKAGVKSSISAKAIASKLKPHMHQGIADLLKRLQDHPHLIVRRKEGWIVDAECCDQMGGNLSQFADDQAIKIVISNDGRQREKQLRRAMAGAVPILELDAKGHRLLSENIPAPQYADFLAMLKHDQQMQQLGRMAAKRWAQLASKQAAKAKTASVASVANAPSTPSATQIDVETLAAARSRQRGLGR